MELIKNNLNDKISKNDNKDFDLLFLVDATGSMQTYITSAKEETKNISKELRNLYPERNFKYGYIFYRDPIDSPSDIHEVIDLTDDVNSLTEKIAKINATGGGDLPEDWAGAYKIVNERISWRKGEKVIIHITDAGAHGKLFTLNDKYPNEEGKLVQELEKCALKKINIFGFVIEIDSKKTFNECAKIYRNKEGFFYFSDFYLPENKMIEPMNMLLMMYMNNMNNMNIMNFNNMNNNNMNSNNMMNINSKNSNNMMNSNMNNNNMNDMNNMNNINMNHMSNFMNMSSPPMMTNINNIIIPPMINDMQNCLIFRHLSAPPPRYNINIEQIQAMNNKLFRMHSLGSVDYIINKNQN